MRRDTMRSSPRATRQDRPESCHATGVPKRVVDVEGFALEVIRRVTGARVEPYDDNSRPRMVDGVMLYPDGRSGAIEVTTIGDPVSFESQSALADMFGEGLRWDELEWAWVVYVPSGVSVRELHQRLRPTLSRCERMHIRDPDRLRDPPRWLQWFIDQGIGLAGFPESGRGGAVDVMPDLRDGGAVPTGATAVVGWVDVTLLADDRITRRLDKLLDHAADEHHLFVRTDPSAMKFPELYALTHADDVPECDPAVPDGLDGLWLAGRWNAPLVWRRGVGWLRADVLGP